MILGNSYDHSSVNYCHYNTYHKTVKICVYIPFFTSVDFVFILTLGYVILWSNFLITVFHHCQAFLHSVCELQSTRFLGDFSLMYVCIVIFQFHYFHDTANPKRSRISSLNMLWNHQWGVCTRIWRIPLKKTLDLPRSYKEPAVKSTLLHNFATCQIISNYGTQRTFHYGVFISVCIGKKEVVKKIAYIIVA